MRGPKKRKAIKAKGSPSRRWPLDTRNKVKGGGAGGVKRRKSKPLRTASKKMVKTSRKMNQAVGRKYKKRK